MVPHSPEKVMQEESMEEYEREEDSQSSSSDIEEDEQEEDKDEIVYVVRKGKYDIPIEILEKATNGLESVTRSY